MKLKNKFLLICSILIVISLFPSTIAEEVEDVADYSSLTLDLSIEGGVDLSKSGKVDATLSLLPKEDNRQSILSFKEWSSPAAKTKQTENSLTYSWSSVKSGQFGIDSRVQTVVIMPGSTVISFPPKITENLEYTKATEKVDISPDITKKANEIVSGKTDTLKAVAALADFVYTNIVYDELYIPTSKKASWVLKNQKGVCDEYATLFIAFCRSLNIPAKYVTGIAFSNIKNEFGNHAWTEVYLPGHGWLPFDPTYGQYGFVDSTHIALAKSKDTQSSVAYSYPASTPITSKELEIDADVLTKLNKFTPKTEISLNLLRNNIKDNTYMPLEVTVKNLQDYYLPLSVYITKSSGLYGKNSRHLLLSPKQEKKLSFILKSNVENPEKNILYTATIEVKTSYNNIQTTPLQFSKNYEQGFSLTKALELVEELKEGEEQYNVDLECEGIKSEFYEDEEIKATCQIENRGNVFLEDLNLCIKEDCKQFDLAIGKQKTEEFTLGKDEEDYIVTVKNDLMEESEYLGINILEKPNLKIISLKPRILDYDQDSINLTLETKSKCEELSISINNLLLTTEKIELRKEIPINFAGKNALGEKIRVKAECKDLRGRLYTDEKTFEVGVVNAPFYAKILQVFFKLFGL